MSNQTTDLLTITTSIRIGDKYKEVRRDGPGRDNLLDAEQKIDES